jgi:hypothetical protein
MSGSPVCVVADNYPTNPFVSTPGGVNVTPNDTISIQLQSTTGVATWFLLVYGTDELTTPPTLINVNPSTNQVTSPTTTVTFTFPNADGRAIIFQSTITPTSGPNVTTTFSVYSLTANGNRVGAVGETREGSTNFGWTTILNPLIRAGAAYLYYDDGIASPTTGSNNVQGAIDYLKTHSAGSPAPIANVYYVSTTGDDISGNGSISTPFATYGQAATVALAQSPAPSTSNPFTIVFAPGTYSENVALQPYVSLSGFDLIGSTILTGTAGLGTGFAGVGVLTSGLSSVLLNSTPSFTFTTVDESILTLDHCIATQGFVNVSAQNTAGGSSTATLNLVDCQISATVNTTDMNVDTYNSTIGSVNVTTSLSSSIVLNGFGGYINSLNLSGVSHAVVGTMEGTAVALLSLTGTQATYAATIEGIPSPANTSLFTSATAAQITTFNPPAGTFLKSTFLTSSSGSFTTSALTNKIRIRGAGGGGAGGGAPSGSTSAAVGCGGGGAGGNLEAVATVTPTTGYAYTCGSAGTGSSGSHGTSGGNSTFTVGATTYTAQGGAFAPTGTPQTNLTGSAGGGGGSASGGFINTSGQNGLPGFAQGSASSSILAQGVSGNGGSGPFGAGGLGVISQGNGGAATGFGSGGAGGMAGYNGSTNAACTGGNATAGCWAVDEFT